MMEMTRTDPEWKDKIITGDETCVYGYDPETKPQSAEWRDIAPNDFFLFPKLKAVLKGRHFDTRNDIIEKSPLALKSIPKEAYKNCFDNWEKRWRCWNEWLNLPIKISELPRHAVLTFTILDAYYPLNEMVVGSTAISVFEENGLLRQGFYELKVWPKVEADGKWNSSTPGLPSTNSKRLNQLKKGLKEFHSGDLQKCEWLDKHAVPVAENINHSTKKNSKTLLLNIEFPKITYQKEIINVIYYEEEARQTLIDLYPETNEASYAKFFAIKLAGHNSLEDFYRNKCAMGLQLGLPQEVLLETLTEGLPAFDQRLTRVAAPKYLSEWFGVVSRVRGNNTPPQRQQDDALPNMSGPFHSTPQRGRTAAAPPSPCRHCGGPHWNADCHHKKGHLNARAIHLGANTIWDWDEACQAAFNALKDSLTTHPVLHLYQEGLQCQVYCDASTLGIADANLIKSHQQPAPSGESKLILDRNGLHTMTRRGVTKVVIPDTLRTDLLNTVHARYNHPDISQMTSLISAQYYWKGMSKDIANAVKTCPICQLTKPPRGPTFGELGQLPLATQPFDLVSLDTIARFAKYGITKTYLHVAVDHLTRYAWMVASRSTSIHTYQQVIKKVLQDGTPKRLLADRAPAFTSPKFKRFLLNRNIHPLLTTSNNPQSNGLCERLNATLTGKLRLLHLENPKIAWTKLVTRVTTVYNNTPHSVTRFPPIYLMFGTLPPEFTEHLTPYRELDAARRIAHKRTQTKHLRDKRTFDKQHKAPHFEPGDLVLVKIYQHPNTGTQTQAVHPSTDASAFTDHSKMMLPFLKLFKYPECYSMAGITRSGVYKINNDLVKHLRVFQMINTTGFICTVFLQTYKDLCT
ncbi:hypothetical protein LAZ67_9002785 [Cordylochernes scorpioides]|uniref:RNA-directed DNA polymerase n=1 Tax=Cordylochernes scorpioides TaxID=51811 RepID=A0ABY6KXS5_9ARAC|nr:hypothetical protein LAZ67_9002785 [Cordylochernes scorpioides]